MPTGTVRRISPLMSAAMLVLLAVSSLPAAGPSVALARPATPAQPQSTTVINFPNNDLSYSPANVRISAGDSVTWQGAGGVGGDFAAHPLVSDEGLWPVQTTGTSFTFTFTQAGLYHFHCQLHGSLGMVGTVLVAGKERSFLPLLIR